MMAYPEAARKCAAALTVTLCLSTPLFARKTTDHPIARIHIDNFGQVSDTYYRGAQPNAQGFAELAALGVRAVIDLTGEDHGDEKLMVEHTGMKFYRIPLTTSAWPSQSAISLFLKLVSDPVNQPVFVHCQGGRHRTGVMTAVYRMTHDSWTAEQAVAEMKQFRFDRFPTHPSLKSFVFDYYSHLQRAKIAEREPLTEAGASK
jgi:protein tyrosine/serine phosphatase